MPNLISRALRSGSYVAALFMFAMPSAQSVDLALIAKGKELAQACVACHSADGNSVVPMFPKLAGQHEAYLSKQMMDLKAHTTRDNAMMLAPMMALNPNDDKALAAYFASQTLKPEVAKHPEWKAVAEKLYRAGDARRGLAACASCHGPAGRGMPNQYPSISGQFADYLKAQLIAFRSGARHNDPEGMMQSSAKLLTDTEIDALADYISGLRYAQ